ncbi:hypothetical protein E3T55_15135 [Cryobacterium frigoriphilum]|uniref:AbiEi antitoxin N-terminal domain-containing protein n=1 Tax=Cryobacterium frigoriphilum TaxID=1259150 RepID=A0A4R8ZWB0_9MICO|nr:type IV toxin-antitoxin system AbiEi family antitoxin domain-containing protein [Cryobacterium frigoriphilum]TFD47878.1 hypothetical protein E3T55_15135 [Cryobacterium frigoriphilum]
MDPLELARQSLILTCDSVAIGRDDTRLSRAVKRGTLVRLKQGVYLDRELWAPLGNADRHRLLATIAERLAGPGLVFSHQTAAALIGLPVLGRWPDRAHVLKECATGGRSTTVLNCHTIGLRDVPVTTIGTLTMTSPARTVIDLAASAPFDVAVIATDAALHADRRTRQFLTTNEDVRELIERMSPFRGLKRVLAVLDASTPLSESVGESLCRIIIAELGFAEPELQAGLRDADGLIGFADFTWQLAKVILEFDGKIKYLDARFRGGLSSDQIVVIEKLREDRLRALGYLVVRATWDDLVDPTRLLRLLTQAGLVPVRATRIIRRDWL